jgi:hypothetical protein
LLDKAEITAVIRSNNDFLIKLLQYYLLVGNSELVIISSTGKMWNSEEDEVENTLNGPHSLSTVMDGARIDVEMQGVLVYMWKGLITYLPSFI